MPYFPRIELERFIIKGELIELFPEDLVKLHNIMPVFKLGNKITIATDSPGNLKMIDDVQAKVEREIDIVVADQEKITKTIAYYYGELGGIDDVISHSVEAQTGNAPGSKMINEIEDASEDAAPIINLVNLLINQAISNRASDLHIGPEEHDSVVRIRVDGELKAIKTLPKKLHAAVASRLKVMGQMDIAKSREPQDGQTQIKLKNKVFELRISILPTIHGENIVIRVLDKSAIKYEVSSLNLPKEIEKTFNKLIRLPYGMFLVTGPTGSGKTTTLYTVLSVTSDVTKNVITIEDPVEYQLPMIRQVQVNRRAGLDFHAGLKSMLRQDPDIIMVGEIRDLETAQLAVRAALTGHMVFSTLHTNDAPSTIARLIDMGVEPFLVEAAVSGITAQRLVRVICNDCKEKYDPNPDLLESIGLSKRGTYFRGKGCKSCEQSGFLGRKGIFEFMVITEAIKEAILGSAPTNDLRKLAVKEGMVTLKDSVLERVKNGETTPEEALKITHFLD